LTRPFAPFGEALRLTRASSSSRAIVAAVTEPLPRLHVERQGSGPALVLAHGFGGSARNFRLQLKALAPHATAVAYDARGHSRSDAPPNEDAYVFERLVDDFERVASEAGEQIVAGGISLGAMTALGFAARRPERVRGLLLASLPGTDEPRLRWARDFATAIEREGLDAAGAAFVWGERSRFDPAGAKLIRQGLLEHPAHSLMHVLRATLAVLPNVRALAAPRATPTLTITNIVGEEDEYALAPSQALVEVLPRARLVLVPNAGHVVNLIAPAVFNAELEKLVAR
jgi:2-succinyl-6-hydroxy-2,4-cyclohexadiene-1-carboxylate synthase